MPKRLISKKDAKAYRSMLADLNKGMTLQQVSEKWGIPPCTVRSYCIAYSSYGYFNGRRRKSKEGEHQ